MPPRSTFNRELITRIFFFTAFAFLLYQLFLLARPFLTPMLIAVLLGIGFYPVHKKIRRRVVNSHLAAVISTATVVLMIVGPLIGMAWLLFHESDRLLPTIQTFIENWQRGEFISLSYFPEFIQNLGARVSAASENYFINPKTIIFNNIRAAGLAVAEWGAFVSRNIVFTFFKVLFLIFSLFFVFRDGEVFLRWLLNIIPMEKSHKEDLARSAYETFRAVTVGVFLTAAAQGALAFIGFALAGVRLPLFLGLATFATSLLGASSLVTIPVALLIIKHSLWKGLFLLFWGAIVVGLMDNFLRPILIGSRTRMPFFLIFFSLLGGLKMYGLLGLILGPLLVASVLTFIRLYREAYLDERDH